MSEARQKTVPKAIQSKKSDIAVIMFDQLSAKWLEKASELGLAPNIDRLRMMGTTFPNAFSSTPICMPARSSMVTGMTARQHGVLTNGYFLNPQIPTCMGILQQHGYRTGGFGKFHLCPEIALEEPDYHEYGFDVAEKSEDWEKWCLGGFLEKNQQEKPGFFFSVKDEEKTQTAWITRRGMNFLRQAERKYPLYAFISFVEPHAPYTPPAGYTDMIDIDSLPEAIKPAWHEDECIPKDLFSQRADWVPYFHYDNEVKSHPKEFWLKARRYYFADIAHLDEQVGKILDILKETERLGNTYILLTADHGDLLGDHGFCEKGWAHYDACIRVPMIVAGPGLEGNQKRDEIVQLEDIFFTLLEMAGSLPAGAEKKVPIKRSLLYWAENSPSFLTTKPLPPLPGFPQSLLPFCRGERREGWRNSAYIESYEKTLDCWTRSVRNSKFRYTYFPGGGEQLFHLESDPSEIINLAADPSYRDIRRQMRDELLERTIAQDYPPTPRDCRHPRMY